MTAHSIGYAGPMGWRFFVLASVAVLGFACTKQNPKSCRDGVCNDPSLPYCDVGGELSGTAFTCVAGDCTPNEFAACRGDTAITCNAAGTTFDDVLCERGCDTASGGCRLCNPNETACTNGTLATCDAAGTVVASKKCTLGCFEDEPRCRDIDPSNGLGLYLDSSDTAPDLVLPNGGNIDTELGIIKDSSNNVITLPTALIAAPSGGSKIRVFVANKVELGGTLLVSYAGQDLVFTGPALAIVANSDVNVSGEITFWSDNPRVIGTAGGVDIPGCSGKQGQILNKTSPSQALASGWGGGGHATAGGRGGEIEFQLAGGAGGAAVGSPELVPLRGGCAGGYGGGGAIQVSSRTRIHVGTGAIINVNGLNGQQSDAGFFSIFAPGAGGGILLEAPIVELESNARVLANGGASPAGGMFTPVQPSLTTMPAQGGTCTQTASFFCSNGGNGAASGGPATDGAKVAYTNSPTVTQFQAGSGGGGLGYIRINTADGSYAKSSSTIESGALSTGPVKTR
jgi:hypothetical protein